MKKHAFANLRLILITSILFLSVEKIRAQQTPPIMERRLYVDDFLRFNSSNELMPESSILGVDVNQDGTFEKEDELLEFARDNHFTILTLYETELAFSATTYYAWNAQTSHMETMQEHLCRFMDKAKNTYCIKEIYSAVGGSGEGEDITEFNEQFKIATPAFELSPEELAYASTRLKLLVNSYPEAHPMHYPSEIAKFALRIAHFQSCNNLNSKFDGVSSEYEFWNNNNNSGFEELMRDLDDIKFSYLSSTTGRHFYINVYYGRNAVSLSPSSEIAFLDGTISQKRIADRIFFESYTQKPFSNNSGLPTRRENYFGQTISNPPTSGEVETKPNTQITTILAAEARRNGSTYDAQGKWMENYETGDQVNNIFECEKQNFLNWFDAGTNTEKGDNQMYPGGYQWFSSSYLLKSFKNQPLFYIEYPNACTSQPNYKVMYKGPTESGLNLHFVLTGPSPITLNVNSPDIALTPDLFFVDDVLIPGNYTATLTIANSCGSGGKSYSESFVVPATAAPQISAIGYQGSPITVCDGEKIILKAPSDYDYQWTKGGADLTDVDATNQFYPVTEAGTYNCKLSCSGGTASPVNDIVVSMKYNPYVSITAVPAGSNNYNLIAEVANVRNGTAFTNRSGMLKYEWTTGETGNMITVDGDEKKKYSVTVSNLEPSNTCRSSNSISVSGNGGVPTKFKLTTSLTSCTGTLGETTLTIAGISPSTVWNSSGEDITKGVITDGATVRYIAWYSQPSIIIANLDPGRYVATATINGAAPTASTQPSTPVSPYLPTTFDIGSQFSPSPIVGSIISSSANCKGAATGSVSVTLNGTGDFTVTLIGSPQKQTVTLTGVNVTINFTNLPAGQYGLKVNNACNFEYRDNIVISEPAGLTVTANDPSIFCNNPTTPRTLTLSPSGGTPPYTYSWSNGTTSNPLVAVPGTYKCIISSSNSCSEKFTYKIGHGSEIHVTTKCMEDGSTRLLVYGGTPPYSLSPSGVFTLIAGSDGEYSGVASQTPYTVIATDNHSCTSAATSINIPAISVSPALAGNDQVICGNSDMNTILDATAPVSGTGTWSVILGNGGVISRPYSPTSLFTGVRGESYLLRWTVAGAIGCPSYDNVMITFHESPHPTPAYAGPDQTICGTDVTLAGNIPIVGTGKWTIIDGNGNLDYPEAPNATFTGRSDENGPYEYTLRWTTMNGDCPSSDEVAITLAKAAKAAIAGPDQTVDCFLTPTSTVSLAANTTGPNHTGTWTKISGPGTFSSTSPTATITGAPGETYVLRWTLTRNIVGCTSSDDVVLKFSPVTTVNAGPDQIVCGKNKAVLSATAPANAGEGVWSIVSGTGTFDSNTDPEATFTGTAGNSYVLRWTITPTGGCGSVVSDDVNIDFPLTNVNSLAGMDQKLCGVTNAVLSANAPTGTATGNWLIMSGANGNVTNSGSNTSSFTGAIGETYVLRWRISDGNCISDDYVEIAMHDFPTQSPNAGSDQLGLCGAGSVNLAANTPTGTYTGKWTVKSGGQGTFIDATNPVTTFTGTNGNAYTLQWEISDLWCSNKDELDISFFQDPTTASAGLDKATCVSNVTLDANVAFVGIGTWTIETGPNLNISQINYPHQPNAVFAPTATGVYKLRWTIANSPCTDSWDEVNVTYNQTPTTANAGPDQYLCGATSATLTANTPSIGTGTWSVIAGGGNPPTQVNNPSATFSGGAGNTYTLRWTISNGLCADKTDDVIISFPTSITSNAGNDQTVCTSTIVTLNGNPAGTHGQWTLGNVGSGTINNAGSYNATVTNLAVGINKFHWTIDNSATGCGISMDEVVINGIAPPAAPVNSAGPDQIICGNSTTFAALSPTAGTGTWSLVSGQGTIANTGDRNSAVSGLSDNVVNRFRWNINNPPCGQALDEMTITVTKPANAGPDQTGLCGTGTMSTTLAANTPILGTGTWSIVGVVGGGTGSFIDVHDPATTFNGTAGSSYTLQWSTPLSICSTTDNVIITFNNLTPVTIASVGPDQLICGGSPAQINLVALTGPAGGETGQWSKVSGPTGSFIGSTTSQTARFDGGPGTYVFRWTISNSPCTSSFDEVTVIVNDIATSLSSPTTPVSGANYVSTSFDLSSMGGTPMVISGGTISFAPGTHITVTSGETLKIFNSTLRACGNDMWGGIIVETGGTLIVDQNSKIEDAEIGADFETGSHCQISNAIFNKCFISSRLQGNVDDTKHFRNVKFYCQDFSGQPTMLLAPHTGIRASGISLINSSLYIVGNYITEFKNLRAAINSYNTTEVALSISNCSFNDLQDPDPAISTRGIEMSRGALSVSESEFTNCDVAIYTIDCGVNVVHSNFENLNTSISASHPMNRSINISYNDINCRRSGVDLLLMEGAYRAQVLSNTIIVGDPLNPVLYNSYGIQYSSSSTTYNNSRIGGNLSYNNITLLSKGEAIGMNYKTGMTVSNNYVALQNSAASDNQIGVKSLNNKKVAASCNYIAGDDNSPGGKQTAMDITAGQPGDPRVSCNSFFNAHEGLVFMGNHGHATLRHNHFDDDYSGLHLKGSTFIGPQYHLGNYWSGTYTSDLAAKNETFAVSPNLNERIYINANPGDPYYPTASTTGWFYPDANADEAGCSFTTTIGGNSIQIDECSSVIPIISEVARTRPTDVPIIRDLLPLSDFREEIRYMAMDEIFARVNEFPELQDNNITYAEFYDSIVNNSNIERFGEVVSTEVNWDGATESLVQNIENKDVLINWHLAQIAYNDSIGDSTHLALNSIHMHDIEVLSQENEALKQLLETGEYPRILQARLVNEDIEINNLIEDNLRTINEVRLDALERESFEFTSDAMDLISQIAHQCPLAGGDGVSIARALYALSHPNEYYDDKSACLFAGYFRKAHPKSENKMVVSALSYFTINPNPASEKLQLSYFVTGNANLEFTIFNSLEQKVKSVILPSDNREYSLNCLDLQTGIYLYSVRSNSEIIHQGKISIVNP